MWTDYNLDDLPGKLNVEAKRLLGLISLTNFGICKCIWIYIKIYMK